MPGGLTTAAVPSPKLAAANPSKQHNSFSEVEPNLVSGRAPVPPDEDGRTRSHGSKFQRETPGGGSAGGSGHNSLLLAHPGELVICKKKRKDRDKSIAKQRMGQVSPSNPGRAGPMSPPIPGRVGPPASTMSRGLRVPPLHKDAQHPQQSMQPSGWNHQQTAQQQQQQHVSGGGSAGVSPNVGEVQWAKPAKRMRTDTGKRRPSHL